MSGFCAPPAVLRVPPPPPALPGFESVLRFWDPRRGRYLAKIGPGQLYLTRGDELITTVLGSCIAACVRDPLAGVAGMNHFMLPLGGGSGTDGAAARYGNFAMEQLLNHVLEHGGARDRLELKLFGGARVTDASIDVGQRNVDFMLRYARDEGLTVAGRDLGGRDGRRLVYEPDTGRALMKRLRGSEADVVRRAERAYASALDVAPAGGDVELF